MAAWLQSRQRATRAVLLATTALAAVALTPRLAWAVCLPTGGPNDITCSGATVGLTVDVTTPADITVTMSNGSSIATDGVVLFGDKDNALNPVNPAFNVTYTELGGTTINNTGVGFGNGISAGTSGDNNVRVTTHSASQINAANNGVDVYAAFYDGTCGAYVNSNGSIVAGGNGVFGFSNNGSIQVVNTGRIGFDSVAGAVSRVGLHGVAVATYGFATSQTDRINGFASIQNDGEIHATVVGLLSSTLGGQSAILNRGLIDAGGQGIASDSLVEPSAPGFPDPTVAALVSIANEGSILSGDEGISAESTTRMGIDAASIAVTNRGSISPDRNGLGASAIRVSSASTATGGTGEITIANALGATIDNATGRGVDAVSISNPNTSHTGAIRVFNAGAITTAVDAAVFVEGNNDGAGASGEVRVENSGVIRSGVVGINANAFAADPAATAGDIVVVNSGTINAQTTGVLTHSVSAKLGANSSTLISNSGTIVAGGAAIGVQQLQGLTQIVNSGLLQGAGQSNATAVIAIDPAGNITNAPTSVVNSGVVRSNDNAPDALAVASNALAADAVSIANTGLVNGRVALTDSADVFANSGVWRSTGTSDFFGGANRIDNSGVIQVANTAAGAGQAAFSATGGTLVLNNAGVMDLWSDGAHSVANTMTVNGALNAQPGSRLAVDAQLGAAGSVADRLTVNGAATGGTTLVSIYNTIGGLGAPNAAGITVARLNGANSGGGFALNPSTAGYTLMGGVPMIDAGLYAYALEQGAGVGCDGAAVCYSLYSGPSTKARILPVAVTTTQSLWQETALMWEDRQTELRDARGSEPNAPTRGRVTTWVKPLGAWTTRNDHVSTNIGPRPVSLDLSYRQNSFGMVGGANYGVRLWRGELNFGVLGGYVESNVTFRGGQFFRYQGGTAGASASFMKNGFFVDGLFKVDALNLQLGVPLGPYGSLWTSAETLGGVWNAGYRYDWGRVFIEPTATLTYSATRIDRLTELSALGADVRFRNSEDFRGGFGGRVGTTVQNVIPGHALEASLTGRFWDQFARNSVVTIVSSGIGDTVGDDTMGRFYGEAKGNLALLAAGPGLAAYVSGGARFNDQFTTWTARGGVAYRW